MSFLFKKKRKKSIVKEGLRASKENLGTKLASLFSKSNDDEFFDKLEELFIMYDVGVETTLYIIDIFKKKIKENNSKKEDNLKELLKESLFDMIPKTPYKAISNNLNIIFVFGVNGVGKTTSIGKLGYHFKNKLGKNVMFAACDTFRAAAIDQLEVWAKRIDIPIIKHKMGSSAGAVLHDAIDKAYSKASHILIVDTAGRFHTRVSLVEELEKLSKIINKKAPKASRENLLVLDAGTGQNAFAQTKKFSESIGLDGIILSKFDSSAKGGIVLPLAHRLNLAIKFLGIGENKEDIVPFDKELYIKELLMVNS